MFDTRPSYYYFLVISVGLLLAIMVFLLGGGWLHNFITSPKTAWLHLILWIALVVMSARVLAVVREHGRIIVTPTSFTQKQIIGTTAFNFSEVTGVNVTTSTRTVAQNGVTVRVPRFLAVVALRNKTTVPVVLSVFSEADQQTIRALLDSAAQGQTIVLPADHPVSTTTGLFYRALIVFACLGAIIPVVVYYGKK